MNNRSRLLPALIASLSLALGAQFASAASTILNGNFLRVGVNDSGGLIDSAFTVGIDYDSTGTGTPTGFDFLKPGSPFEFYSIGVNGSWNAAGYTSGNPFGATTTNTSAGSLLSTSTTGAWGGLAINQQMSFVNTGGFIDFSVTLTNNGTSALNNVVYARGLDPDQDVYAGGGYPTTNTVVNGNLVTGSAPVTDWTIGIFSNSLIPHTPSVRRDWGQNPYDLLNPINDGYGDYTINMAWNVGTLGAGQSANIAFQYRIAETSGEVINPPTPGVPDGGSSAALLGSVMLGLAALRRRWKR